MFNFNCNFNILSSKRIYFILFYGGCGFAIIFSKYINTKTNTNNYSKYKNYIKKPINNNRFYVIPFHLYLVH